MEYPCLAYKSPAAICLGIIFLPICLLASVPGDEHWDNQFGPVGVSDPAYSITTLGNKIYVGGVFYSAGNTKASAVAGYDGTNWTALNNGIAGDFNITYVFSLASDGANVYAGGIFTNADGSGAKYLACWDGANWSPLGGNITNNPSSIVEAVKYFGTNLYAGGAFLTAGGVPVNDIAKWNGTSWSALGTGISGGTQPVVEALEYDGTNVYAGGSFTLAGGMSVANIAQWNGTNWSAMGTGLPGQVLALARGSGYLYAGGAFTNTSLAITNVAKWDGNTWSAVGASGANRIVRDLVSDGTNLYVGGDFTTAGGLATKCIVKWNGSSWSALGAGVQSFGVGVSPNVSKMAIDAKGRLCIAGNFNQAGGMGTSHVAIWDGTNWMAAGGKTSKGMTHFIGDVQSLLFDGTNLYAGGLFTEAGSNVVDGIAQWDGTNWSSLGTVTTGIFPTTGTTQVKAMARAGGILYAGGNFTNINGATALNVAQWNGSAWAPMASGLNGSVFTLAIHKGVLYAGGTFTGNGAGTASLHGIAQWTGSDWADVPLIESWRVNNVFNALVSDGINLYAGGNYYIIILVGDFHQLIPLLVTT